MIDHHYLTDIGRQLHEQCLKSMKDFVGPKLDDDDPDFVKCKCQGRHKKPTYFFRCDMYEYITYRPDGSRAIRLYCQPCHKLHRPRYMKGQGNL